MSSTVAVTGIVFNNVSQVTISTTPVTGVFVSGGMILPSINVNQPPVLNVYSGTVVVGIRQGLKEGAHYRIVKDDNGRVIRIEFLGFSEQVTY